MARITIDPMTRLEGHGKIEIFLDDDGNVVNSYLQVPELRGFERFCVGRPVEEMPVLTNRICGVCPERNHMARREGCGRGLRRDAPPAGRKLRELLYSAFYFAGPHHALLHPRRADFIMGPDAPVAERNILGVIHKVGLEIGSKVIQARHFGHTTVEMIGGRKVHPARRCPRDDQEPLRDRSASRSSAWGAGRSSSRSSACSCSADARLGNPSNRDLIVGDAYSPPYLVHSAWSDAQKPRELLRRARERGLARRRARRHLRAARVHRLDQRARGALELPQVPVPQEGRLEGLRRRQGLGRLHGDAAVAAECGRRHGDPARPGGVRALYATLGGKPVHQRLAIHWRG